MVSHAKLSAQVKFDDLGMRLNIISRLVYFTFKFSPIFSPTTCFFFSRLSLPSVFNSFLILQLLAKDPTERLGCKGGGASEVKAHPIFRSINFKRLEAGMLQAPFIPDVGIIQSSTVYDLRHQVHGNLRKP